MLENPTEITGEKYGKMMGKYGESYEENIWGKYGEITGKPLENHGEQIMGKTW